MNKRKSKADAHSPFVQANNCHMMEKMEAGIFSEHPKEKKKCVLLVDTVKQGNKQITQLANL